LLSCIGDIPSLFKKIAQSYNNNSSFFNAISLWQSMVIEIMCQSGEGEAAASGGGATAD
jgi:hypothetical protein